MNTSVIRGGPLARGLTTALAGACSALVVAACAASSPASQAAAGPPAAKATASVAAAAAFGPAAAGAAAAPATPDPLPPAGGLPRCRTGQLSTAFTGLNFASGGGAGMTLILT